MNNFEEDVMVVVERVEKELTNSMSKLKIDYPDEKDFVLSLFAELLSNVVYGCFSLGGGSLIY